MAEKLHLSNSSLLVDSSRRGAWECCRSRSLTGPRERCRPPFRATPHTSSAFCHAASLGFQTILLQLLSSLTVVMATASEQSLEEAGIVPDVVTAELPKGTLHRVTVTYGGKAVPPGEFISAPSAAPCPTVKVDYDPQANEMLFIFMTDPDAPSRSHPVGAEWAHWAAISRGNVFDAMTEAPLPYSGPSPPSATGLHRYVFLVYKGHANRLHGIPPPDQRRRWGGRGKVETIAKENGLKLLGLTWMTSSSA